jgi:DNA-binding NarL/FixJ family response regulator
MVQAILPILGGIPTVEIVGACGSARELLSQLSGSLPDLILLDLGMAVADNFSLLRRLRADSGSRIVLLTLHDGIELRTVARDCMGDAWICKSRLDLELPAQIERLFSK